MFKSTTFNLGRIQSEKPVRMEFPYEDIKIITRMESPCECTTPVDKRKESKVTILYTPKRVPVHLIQQGQREYSTQKVIKIYYLDKDDNQQFENLTFTATIFD